MSKKYHRWVCDGPDKTVARRELRLPGATDQRVRMIADDLGVPVNALVVGWLEHLVQLSDKGDLVIDVIPSRVQFLEKNPVTRRHV